MPCSAWRYLGHSPPAMPLAGAGWEPYLVIWRRTRLIVAHDSNGPLYC